MVQAGDSGLFSVDFEQYRTPDENLPIGVFDSGIGGLTVLNEILTIDRFNNLTHEPGPDGQADFENESFIYLGDQANMPYGNYPSEQKTAFLKELVLKDAVFLLGNRYWASAYSPSPRRDKPPVKAIVIACNTATSYGLADIHDALKQWGIPIFTVGVVAAGADGAIESLGEMNTPGAVAVMATVGTCQSEGYVREIIRSSNMAEVETPEIIQQGSLGLASAIEGNPEYIVPTASATFATYRGPAVDNPDARIDLSLIQQYAFDPGGLLGDREDPATWRLNSVDNYIRYDTTSLVENHKRSGSTEPITTVILGCTHFPFYQDAIEADFDRLREIQTAEGEVPYRDLIAEDVVFIDPAELTAVQLYEALAENQLLLDDEDGVPTTADEFYISVPNSDCSGGRAAARRAILHLRFQVRADAGSFGRGVCQARADEQRKPRRERHGVHPHLDACRLGSSDSFQCPQPAVRRSSDGVADRRGGVDGALFLFNLDGERDIRPALLEFEHQAPAPRLHPAGHAEDERAPEYLGRVHGNLVISDFLCADRIKPPVAGHPVGFDPVEQGQELKGLLDRDAELREVSDEFVLAGERETTTLRGIDRDVVAVDDGGSAAPRTRQLNGQDQPLLGHAFLSLAIRHRRHHFGSFVEHRVSVHHEDARVGRIRIRACRARGDQEEAEQYRRVFSHVIHLALQNGTDFADIPTMRRGRSHDTRRDILV